MRIEVVKVKFDDEYSYKYLPFKYCCEKLKHNPNISLNTEYETQQDFCTNCEFQDKFGEECEICKAITASKYDDNFPSFKMCRTEIIHDWEDEFEQTYYLSIEFCPHCGEKIEIVCVKEIDKTEEFKNLNK